MEGGTGRGTGAGLDRSDAPAPGGCGIFAVSEPVRWRAQRNLRLPHPCAPFAARGGARGRKRQDSDAFADVAQRALSSPAVSPGWLLGAERRSLGAQRQIGPASAVVNLAGKM